jgi:hypothetical protein
MATAMVTLTWCDWHLTEKDTEEPAQRYTWGDLTVDLCEDCAAPIAQALALFTDYGAKGKRTPQLAAVRRRARKASPQATAPTPSVKAADGTYACPDPGCDSVLKSRQSLGAHARQIHGKSLGELEGRPITHTCDECGAGFTTLQGITLHERKHAREQAAAS